MEPDRLAILAGGGLLPLRLAEAAERQGTRPYVIAIAGAAQRADFARWPSESLAPGAVGAILRALRRERCARVVLAGHLAPPDIASLAVDREGLRVLPRILAAAARGDGALQEMILRLFEENGFAIEGAERIAPHLLARPGPLGQCMPAAADWVDIRIAAKGALARGRAGPGQGAVARHGSLVAGEERAGTDAMLALVSAEAQPAGVLVKRLRPGQDRRIDLPTIGPETLKRAAGAGLAGIVLEAGGALILDPEETAAAADRAGLFVYGALTSELAS